MCAWVRLTVHLPDYEVCCRARMLAPSNLFGRQTKRTRAHLPLKCFHLIIEMWFFSFCFQWLFRRENINGAILDRLTLDYLHAMGVTPIAVAVRVIDAVQSMQAAAAAAAASSAGAGASPTKGRQRQNSAPPAPAFDTMGVPTLAATGAAAAASALLSSTSINLSQVNLLAPSSFKSWISMKKQSGVLRTWERRFLVLQGGVLFFAKSDKVETPLGAITLEGRFICKGEVKTDFSLDHDKERQYVFRCETPAEAIRWKNALLEFSACSTRRDHAVVAGGPPARVLRLLAGNKQLAEMCGNYIRDGVLRKSPASGRGARKYRHFFLFQNVLVYAQAHKKDFTVKGLIEVSGASICEIADEHAPLYSFCIVCDRGRYVVECKSAEEKYEWMLDLTAAVDRALNLTGVGAFASGADEDDAGSDDDVCMSPPEPADSAAASAAAGADVKSLLAEVLPPNSDKARRRARVISIRSLVAIDRAFPKPPVPNCVRIGSWHTRTAASLAAPPDRPQQRLGWEPRREFYATTVRFHSPDALGLFGVTEDEASDLLGVISDFYSMDGYTEHFAEGSMRHPASRPYCPIVYFRWRLQLSGSGAFVINGAGETVTLSTSSTAGDPADIEQQLYVTWGQFQDVFTDNVLVVFALDAAALWLDPAEAGAVALRRATALRHAVRKVAGAMPFMLSLSGKLPEAAYNALLEPFEDEPSACLVDCCDETAEPGHSHTGPFETFVPGSGPERGPEGALSAGADVGDYVLVRSRMVEVMQSGVAQDRFSTGDRAGSHMLLVADCIVDMHPI